MNSRSNNDELILFPNHNIHRYPRSSIEHRLRVSITEVGSNGRIIRIPSHGNPFRVASRRNKIPHVLAIDGDSYRWNRDSREGGLISAHLSATSRPLGDSSVPCRTCLHLLIRLSLSDSLGSYLPCHSPPAGHRPFASPGFHYSARSPSTRRKACGWTKREIGDRTTVRRRSRDSTLSTHLGYHDSCEPSGSSRSADATIQRERAHAKVSEYPPLSA